MKEILDQAKQSIEENKYKHPNVTLATTFYKPAWEANTYVRFVYFQQTIYNPAWVQVSGFMNAYLINANNQVDNQQLKNDH